MRSKEGFESVAKVNDFVKLVAFVVDIVLFFGVQSAVFWVRLQTRFFDQLFPESTILGEGWSGYVLYSNHLVIGTLVFFVLGDGYGIYSRKVCLMPRIVSARLLKTFTAWVLVYLLLSLVFKIEPAISRSFVLLSGILGFVVLTFWRFQLNRWIEWSGLIDELQERVLVIGWNEEANVLWLRSKNRRLREFRFVGILQPFGGILKCPSPGELPLLGTIDSMNPLLGQGICDAVLLVDTEMPAERLSEMVQVCHRELVRFMLIPAFFEVLISGLRIESVAGVPVLVNGRMPLERFFWRFSKRMMDLLGGAVGLIICAPLIAIFALLVKMESPGPVFYRQVRVGLGGRKFRIIKIRSMHLDAEREGGAQWATEGDVRRLRIGAFMRRWNIDELPQLWNVLKGEMSLVGPRPERPEFTKDFKYSVSYYNARHSVKPGMTGWAAVNGWRGNTDLNERIRYDLEYIERWSILFDTYILILTFLRNRNAY